MSGNIPKEIYMLDIIADNPLFEGFAMEAAPSILGRDNLGDDITPGFESSETVREWQPISLAKLWKPPKVTGRVAPYQDFPGVDMIFPAFSRRACDALRDLLEPNGELLPLDSKAGEYYFYNITTVIDALDLEKSRCAFWCDTPTTAVDIEFFAFHEERLSGTAIFRIIEQPIYTLVTKMFIDRVGDCELNGFHFEKVWPFPEGVNWRLEARQLQRSNPHHLKRQSVLIQLMLSGRGPKPDELARFAALGDETDALLALDSLDSPYFGRYEGHEIARGEIRMFLSCPTAEALAAKLLPLLGRLNWKGKIFLTKRDGEVQDVEAKGVTHEVV